MALTQVTGRDGVKDGSIKEADLDITNAGSDGQFLKKAGTQFTWETVSTTDATKMPLAGGTFTGDVTFDNQSNAGRDVRWDESVDSLEFDDNTKATFGTGGELQIYHDGTNNEIRSAGAVDIYIRPKDTDVGVKVIADGACELYHDNSRMLRTTATGGILSGSWSLTDNNKMLFGTGNDLEIYHDGSNSYIKDTGTGNITLQSNQVNFINAAGDETLIQVNEDSDVQLYHNNVKQLATTANGVQTYFTTPYVLLGIDAVQSVANTTSHTVDWVETTDRGGDFDTSNERFTAPVAGDYLICLSIQYTENVNALHTGIYKNGTSPGASFDPWVNWGDDIRAGCTSTILTLAVNDYITLQTYQNTGSAKNLETNRTKATIRFLG